MPSTEDIQPCDHAAGEGRGISVDETLLQAAEVTIASRSLEKLIQTQPEPVHTVVMDVADDGAVEKNVAALSRVDHWLISAGTIRSGTMDTMTTLRHER
jgi:NADP-dependent 3-hydroxy acid dehydrogenase YdfG